PGAGISPMAVGCGDGNAERIRCFWNGHADEITQLHQVRFLFVLRGKFLERLMDGEHLVLVLSRHARDVRQFGPMMPSAMPPRAFAARIIDQNSAHGFSSSGEEMRSVIPFPLVA